MWDHMCILWMLGFSFFGKQETTDQRVRRVLDAYLQTWRIAHETRIPCPCIHSSCLSEPKVPVLKLAHTPISAWVFMNLHLWTNSQSVSHMLTITFSLFFFFCLSTWIQNSIYFWPDRTVTSHSHSSVSGLDVSPSVSVVSAMGRSSPFSIPSQIARHRFSVWELITSMLQNGFADSILCHFTHDLSSP